MPEPVPFTLATLARGGAAELWEKEFLDLLRNISDVNTDQRAKREITLKLTIVPNEDRNVGHSVITVTSKLAAVKRLPTTLYIGRVGGRLVAVENNPKQAGLFDQTPPGPVAVSAGGKDAPKP